MQLAFTLVCFPARVCQSPCVLFFFIFYHVEVISTWYESHLLALIYICTLVTFNWHDYPGISRKK